MSNGRGGIPRWLSGVSVLAIVFAIGIVVPIRVMAQRQVPTPQNLCVCARLSPTAVRLTWADAGPLARSYVLQRSTSESFSSNTQEILIAQNTVDFVDETQTYSTTFFYRIAAQAGPERSVFSNVVRTTNLSAPRPARPAEPTNVGLQDGQDGLRITWRDMATNETGMWIQRSGDNGSTWEFRASLAPNSSSYTDTSPPPSAPIYRVWTFNSGGQSVSYAVQWVTPRAATPSAPAVPSISATVPGVPTIAPSVPGVPTINPSIPAVPTIPVPSVPALPTVPAVDPQLWFGIKSVPANVFIFSLWILPTNCTGYGGTCPAPKNPDTCVDFIGIVALCYYTR